MSEKTFSLEEAQETLKKVKPRVEEVVEINRTIQYTSKDMETLFDIWGDSVMEKGNPDNGLYLNMIEKGDMLADEMKNRLSEIEEVGCHVKDLKLGLIDFPFDHEGRRVFLCWKLGEDKIKYWHDAHAGFTGRKHINELINRPISQEQ